MCQCSLKLHAISLSHKPFAMPARKRVAKPGRFAKRNYRKRSSSARTRKPSRPAASTAVTPFRKKARRTNFPRIPRSPYLKFGSRLFDPFDTVFGMKGLLTPGTLGKYTVVNSSTTWTTVREGS